MRVKHGDQIVEDGIHIVHALEYADRSARAGASGLTDSDIGKVSRQADNDAFYVLKDARPTWTQFGVSQTFVQITTETQEATAAGGTEHLGQRMFNAGDFTNAQYRFNAVGAATAGATFQVGLYNLTRSEFVTGSTLTFTSADYGKQQSSELPVGSGAGELRESDDVYEVQGILTGVAGQTGYLGSALILVEGATGMT